jgi:general secretion pathway protein L
MTESVLDRQLARMRVAYATSPLARFLEWWWGQLRPLLPPKVQAWLAESRDEVLVGLSAERIDLVWQGRVARAPGSLERTLETDLLKRDLAAYLAGTDEPPAIVLTLPPGRVLRRTLSLPAAAEQNLRQVLAFEMDRQTPFKADQVHYDYRIAARDQGTRQLRVDMAVVPRTGADAEVAALAELGVALHGIDIAPVGAAPRPGFNLLPPDRRARRSDIWLLVNVGLGVLCLALLLIAMALSVGNRAAALEAMRETVDRERIEAKAVADLRSELRAAVEGANFLAEAKRAQPVVSDLMLDLTRRLPPDTWLQRFSLTGRQIQLQGQADEAASLIRILQQSQMLQGPAIQGAVTPDARTNQEQFLIQAEARTRVDAVASSERAQETTNEGDDDAPGRR